MSESSGILVPERVGCWCECGHLYEAHRSSLCTNATCRCSHFESAPRVSSLPPDKLLAEALQWLRELPLGVAFKEVYLPVIEAAIARGVRVEGLQNELNLMRKAFADSRKSNQSKVVLAAQKLLEIRDSSPAGAEKSERLNNAVQAFIYALAEREGV